jgi:hypothetical protein
MKKLSILLGSVLLLSAFGSAQTLLTNTTLSSAVADSSTRTVAVTSATGINAPSLTDFTKSTDIYVDRELLHVEQVSGTTLTVSRGQSGTIAQPHVSGAFLFVIPQFAGNLFRTLPNGACTRANELFLPRIEVATGLFSDCLGGQWVNSDLRQSTYPQPNGIRLPDPGGVIYTALEVNGTAPSAATEIYCSEIDLPQSMMLTGLGVLNGTTIGTDNHWMILYDSGGKVLATSAVAGALAASASAYQKFNFLNKYFAVGPARYFGCMGTNGTTATIRHAITSTNDNILGGAVTTQVFGTAANVTLPSSFTTAKAPYLLVF